MQESGGGLTRAWGEWGGRDREGGPSPFQRSLLLSLTREKQLNFLVIFKKDFIYLFGRERERAREHKRGSSRARGRSRKPNTGLDPGTLR